MDWISVKDRLPNVMENVLVYWKNTSQGKEYYEITYYDGDYWCTLDRRPWIEAMRMHKSADTTANILELEHIISDLRGHMEWHKRRVAHESE